MIRFLRRLDFRPSLSRLRNFLVVDRSAAILGAIVSAYAAVMSFVAVMRFNTFRTHAFDLGIFNQAFSTALEGRLFYETPDIHLNPTGSFLGIHFNLLMFLLLPVYALAPRPETLLIVQSIVIALGAVPVFLVSRHVLGKGRYPVLLSLLYLVNPATLSLNLYDFHLEAFLPLFLGMFYYSYLASWWKRYVLFFLLSVFTIEFASVLIGSIALTHLVRHVSLQTRAGDGHPVFHIQLNLPRRRAFLLLGTFLAAGFSLFGILSASAYFANSGRSVPSILSGFLQFGTTAESWPRRATFWALLLGSLLFLPLAALRECVVAIPWFVLTLLPVPVTWYLFGYQYSGAFVAPYLIFAAIRAVGRVHSKQNRQVLVASAILVSVFFAPLNPLMQGNLPGIAYEQGLPIPTSHDAILHQAVALIPPGASVLTQNNLFSQVSGRPNVFLYLPTGGEQIDFVLADTRTADFSLRVWGLTPLSTLLPQMMSTGEYGILASSDGIILLGRGYTGPVLVSGQTQYLYDYHSLIHVSGIRITDPSSQSGVVFYYNDSAPSPNGFWVGPFAHLLPGRYEAAFYLKAGPDSRGNITVDAIHYLSETSRQPLASRTVNASYFGATNNWEPVVVPFVLSYADAANGSMEFASSFVDGGPFSFDYVIVTYLGTI